MDLIRDVLDSQLIDDNMRPMGMVDGLMAELRDDAPPRLAFIECGFPVLARRVHPKLEPIVRWLGRRFGLRRGRVMRIAWSKVIFNNIDTKVRVDAERTPAFRWELALREHIVRHIPGSQA
jgi:hypothetical protein